MNDDLLERAARARMASSPMWKSVSRATPMPLAAAAVGAPAQAGAAAAGAGEPAGQTETGAGQPGGEPLVKMKSIFGSDQVEEMSLDEVILAYIKDEPGEDG
jgi:hypothetical protein